MQYALRNECNFRSINLLSCCIGVLYQSLAIDNLLLGQAVKKNSASNCFSGYQIVGLYVFASALDGCIKLHVIDPVVWALFSHITIYVRRNAYFGWKVAL